MFLSDRSSETILVTGASGFIGARLVNCLSHLGYQVVAMVRSEESDCSAFADLPGLRIVVCQMSEIDDLPRRMGGSRADVCVHLAWQGSAGCNRADADMQIENISHSVHLVRAAKKLGVSRFVGIGSLMEIDAASCLTEDDGSPAPTAAYPVAKTAARFLTKIECAQQSMDYLWCQVSNVYGLGVKDGFVRSAIAQMMSGVPAEFTEGKQLYDFTHIDDTVDAVLAVMRSGKAGSCYYLGSAQPRPLKEYIDIIEKHVNPAEKPVLGAVPYQGAFLSEEALSCKKLYRDTGFRAKRRFEDEIGSLVDSMGNGKG